VTLQKTLSLLIRGAVISSGMSTSLGKNKKPESEGNGGGETRIDYDRPSDQLCPVRFSKYEADDRSPGNSCENADEPRGKVRSEDVE
jgi:hypothetical protein